MRNGCLLGVTLLSGCGFVSVDVVDLVDAAPLGQDAARDVQDDEGVATSPRCEVTRPKTLASAHTHSCALKGTELYCWGDNRDGQLTGEGDTDVFPRLVPGTWLSVGATEEFTCAIGVDGVYCWGQNDEGQLGVGDDMPRRDPTRVLFDGCATRLSVGGGHGCVLDESDALWCWGSNDEDQLALDDRPVVALTPRRLDGTWRDIGTGQGHTMALSPDGQLFGWGRNTDRQLGLGDDADGRFRTPTQVNEMLWTQVVSAQSSSCALTVSADAWCWGENEMNQLGLADGLVRSTPAEIPGGPYSMISAAVFHGCAIADGSLFCWGRGIEGQLGTGDINPRSEPTLVSDFRDWIDVEVGRFHTCARRADESVWCTGAGAIGRLGLGDEERRREFTRVVF